MSNAQIIPISKLEKNTGQLVGLPKNPRLIKDTRFDALKKSIEDAPEMLELRELLVYPMDNGHYIVIGGNMRLEACRAIGYKEVPCKIIPKGTPVEKLREYTIKDNVAFGENDWDIIANEWNFEEIQEWGMESDVFMTDEELVENEVQEDNFDEESVPDDEPITKRGEIFQLGEHRLMCGDSTNDDDVDALMDGSIADLVHTDPPYGVSYVGTNNPNGKSWDMIENDDLRGDGLYQFLNHAFYNIAKHLKPEGAFYVWFASVNHIHFEKALNENGLRVKQELIWDKGMVLGHSDYHWAYEPCLYGCHNDHNSTWYGDRAQKTFLAMNRTDIRSMDKKTMEEMLLKLHDGRACWRINRDNVCEYVHPTQKPLALAATAMRNSSKRGDIVLDLFGGSGSTMMAAEQMGRKCYTMEFDPHYCDVIIARWEKLTGKKARKLN